MPVRTTRSDRFTRFDVVVVPFPYADRLAEKHRPAVVVSIPELTRAHGLVWLAMVTSASHAPWACDIAIEDQRLAGLPAPSMVRPAKLATVDATRIARRLGRLSTKNAASLSAWLARHVAVGV